MLQSSLQPRETKLFRVTDSGATPKTCQDMLALKVKNGK